MIFPLNANKIESLDLDPIKKIEGYIWYNNVEKAYKTWINNELSIFITAKTFKDDIGKFLDEELFKHEFIVSMSDVYKVNIKHNKNNNNFNYTIFDSLENCAVNASAQIISDNEVSFEFVDPLTGHIYMYFQ
jgi:hypothetical protein